MRKIIFILLLAVFSLNQSQAQEIQNDSTLNFKRNSIYLELGGNSVLYSLNYDYTFRLSEVTKLAVGGGLGVLNIASYANSSVPISETTFYITPAANFLFGKKSHHFETGLSLLQFQFPMLRAGYRYQPVKGGFLFRAGFTPIIAGMNFILWAGISFGYTF